MTEADLRWADVVLVMEREHARRLRERFGRDALPDVRCLSIPDRWKFMDPELVKRLREAVERELPEVGSGWCFESGTADGGRGRPG